MLVVFETLVINLNNVQSFWLADSLDGQAQGFYIKFSDALGHKILDSEITALPFKTSELRDKAYRDILFAYQQGMKVFATTNETEEKKE